MKETLKTLVPKYAHLKNEFDSYKKLCDDCNKKIKQIMTSKGSNSEVVEGYKVTCTTSTREKMNELAMIKLLKEKGLADGIVKQKEYIDSDALESCIYLGKIPADVVVEMDKCIEKTSVVTLRVTEE